MNTQIVTIILHMEIEQAKNVIVTNSISFDAGDKVIIRKDGDYVIAVYENGQFNILEYDRSAPAKYIYVSSQSKTVIYANHRIYEISKYFICSKCNKITVNKLKITGGAGETCIHCHYKIVFDQGNFNLFDNKPMSIGHYIKEYSNKHEKCTSPERCFICLFKQKKLNLDINELKIIYDKEMLNILKTNKIEFNIYI